MYLLAPVIISLLSLANVEGNSLPQPPIQPNKSNATCQGLCKDVLFYLYTRKNPENPQQLWIDDKGVLAKSLYDARKPTKFMTHGWLNTHQGLNCRTVKQAFLDGDDYNVILVDWGNIAKLSYCAVMDEIKTVGGYIAKMINFLESQGSNLKNMTLVGHSMGAHVMGLAGYQTTNKVGHLVGLDPAGPLFESETDPEQGISSKDAQLVEVIHTNVGSWGLTRPAGHIDYYVNEGGLLQPGCGADPKHYCAHDRAYQIYAEAVKGKSPSDRRFMAVLCDDSLKFSLGECENNEKIDFAGNSGTKNTKWLGGSYYLRTAESAPFGLGLDGSKPTPKQN